jgi:cytochrome oxidase assembly protein ShyY1
VVDRGWLPIGNKNPGSPDSIPAPPTGPVTAVVRLKHGEPRLDRGAPDGQLASIDLPTYGDQLAYPVLTGAYGQLASESPASAAMPFPFPKPATEEGTHLSYSLQWFAFGVLMFVGFGYAARQQARNAAIDAEDEDENEDGPRDSGSPVHSAAAAARRRAPVARKRKHATSEEEEDALLDAQGY